MRISLLMNRIGSAILPMQAQRGFDGLGFTHDPSGMDGCVPQLGDLLLEVRSGSRGCLTASAAFDGAHVPPTDHFFRSVSSATQSPGARSYFHHSHPLAARFATWTAANEGDW